MCVEVLEDNKATRDVLNIRDIAKPHFLPWLPDPLWRPVARVIARNFVWLTVGMYDPEIRALLGYSWSEKDARRHRRTGRLINALFGLLPHDRRYHPRARAGWRRARGEVAADAPLVETPRRNLPPLSERGKPEHYSPQV